MKILGYTVNVKKDKPKASKNKDTSKLMFTDEQLNILSQLISKHETLLSLDTRDNITDNIRNTLPTAGGRSSVSDSENIGLVTLLNTIVPDVPFEYLGVLEHLSKWNSDFSYAVDNIVHLGSTEFNIEYDDNVTAEQMREMNRELKRSYGYWYNNSDGIDALISDLLAQVAISGCLSAEIVPRMDLQGVAYAVLVAPKEIRFKYDKNTDRSKAYQKVKNWINIDNGLKELNPVTYKYYALRRMNDKPYAIPPMLASLENISIEKDMMKNIKTIVEKLGVLGFLQVLLCPPTRLPGESEEMYQAKCRQSLISTLPQIQNGMRDGFVIGFKGTHEFEMQDVSTNVTGATDLMDLNAQLKMSGLKQDPLMLGRNFSTTETLGRVILAKMTTQVSKYQKPVARFLEEMFTMHLRLKGFNFEFVEVTFDKPMVGDKYREEQVNELRITNAEKLYNAGIIGQTQRANNLGYERPDLPEPRITADETIDVVENPDEGMSDDVTNPDTQENEKELYNLWKKLRGDGENFDYHDTNCNCGCNGNHKDN